MKYREKKQTLLSALLLILGILIGYLIGSYFTKKSFNHLSPDEVMALHFNELYNAVPDNNKNHFNTAKDYNKILSNDTYDKPIYHIKSDIELNFESTIRSCLSTQCFDEPVKENDGTTNHRIGILAPPGSGGEILIKIINKALLKEKKKNIEIIIDTHVPAYGYGKNHGWSRIIRLVRPILLQSMSILNTYYPASSHTLYELQVRQLARWHCRLSHVAAHTKMLTVMTEDLINRPMIEIDKILTFIGYKIGRRELLDAFAEYKLELQKEITTPTRDEILPSFIDSGLSALKNELESTDELQKWPCKSFRELDKMIKRDEPLPIKFNQLAANCSSPYVTCSVPMDRSGKA